MSKRKYTHIEEVQEKVLELLSQGKTQREVAEYFGFTDKYVVKEFIKRHRRKAERMEAGIMPRPKDGLQPVERTVIDRCTRLVYRDLLMHPETTAAPTLQDLHALLSNQPEPEAKRLATALEIYVCGSLNVFNNATNVDLESRVVCLDLKQLGAGLRTIAMLIMQDLVWARVSQNFTRHIATWCYFDEFHQLLADELTASYCVTIWKMLRKKGCVPSALTQNVKDFLASRAVENILENLYCKGWMSNPLLKQQDSQIIRSRMKRFRGKEHRHRVSRQAA